jgi:hypothetical protein
MRRAIVLLILLGAGCTADRLPPSDTKQGQSGGNTPLSNSATARLPAVALVTVQNSAIRSIDFRNFTFDWYPTWADATPSGRRIILKAGEMDLGHRPGKEPFQFYLPENYVEYGDLTGDGVEEAVVRIGIITSGTARPDLVFVYTLAGGKPKRLWVSETGNRADRGLHRVYIEEGYLLLEQYKPDTTIDRGKKITLPSSHQYTRTYLRWNGHSFTKIKAEDDIPLDPNDSSPWTKN